jgi:hypothetical protein
MTFSDEDIVRNPLIKKIEEIFKGLAETPNINPA